MLGFVFVFVVVVVIVVVVVVLVVVVVVVVIVAVGVVGVAVVVIVVVVVVVVIVGVVVVAADSTVAGTATVFAGSVTTLGWRCSVCSGSVSWAATALTGAFFVSAAQWQGLQHVCRICFRFNVVSAS